MKEDELYKKIKKEYKKAIRECIIEMIKFLTNNYGEK